jgi:UrcA family protein
MSTPPKLTRRLSSHCGAVRNATLIGLLAIAPVHATAGKHVATVSETRVAKVSLADLDLSTPEGARAARERLHAMARHLCMRLEGDHDLGHQPHFVACVDETLVDALLQLNSLALASEQSSRGARSIAP